MATKASESSLEQCSSWRTLYQTIGRLIHVAASFKGKSNKGEKKGWKCFKDTPSTSELSQAKAVIIHAVQRKVFKEEFKRWGDKQAHPKPNTLKKLNPVVDNDGLLCVGGHLSSAVERRKAPTDYSTHSSHRHTTRETHS